MSNKQHGLRHHPLYTVWANMKTRCTNPKTHNYKNYGGRGIKVCDQWNVDFTLFYNWALNNGYEPGLTIERINCDGDYTPSNCMWIAAKQQALNKSSNILIQLGENTMCLSEWCRVFKLKFNTVEQRINEYGWTPQQALLTPVKKGGDAYVRGKTIQTSRRSTKSN